MRWARWDKRFGRYKVRNRGGTYWYSKDGETWTDSVGDRLPESEFSCQGEAIHLIGGARHDSIVNGRNREPEKLSAPDELFERHVGKSAAPCGCRFDAATGAVTCYCKLHATAAEPRAVYRGHDDGQFRSTCCGAVLTIIDNGEWQCSQCLRRVRL